MDFLQIALIFLIILISCFLAIVGFQVFFILRDLHKALKRLNKVLDIEKPVATGSGAKKIAKSRRFYKKTL